MKTDTTTETTSADIATLQAEALTLQDRFDALADEHERAGTAQHKRRVEMLAALSGIEHRIQEAAALTVDAEPSDAGRIAEMQQANFDASARFDRVATAYAAEMHAGQARLIALRDLLGEFNATGQKLRDCGRDVPRPLRHLDIAERIFRLCPPAQPVGAN